MRIALKLENSLYSIPKLSSRFAAFASLLFCFSSADVYAQVSISASVSPSEIVSVSDTAQLRWNATNAATCTIDGEDSPIIGTITVGPYAQTGDVTFSIECKGGEAERGIHSALVTLSVVTPPAPIITASISKTDLLANEDTLDVEYSTRYATSCTYDGDSVPLQLSLPLGPFEAGPHSESFPAPAQAERPTKP